MWILTPIGFFSIVEKPADRGRDTLTIRARVRADLDALREEALPTLGPTEASAGTDYAFRAVAPRADVAKAIGALVAGIGYSNFKDEVTRRQGRERAHVYHEVWDVLYGLQRRK